MQVASMLSECPTPGAPAFAAGAEGFEAGRQQHMAQTGPAYSMHPHEGDFAMDQVYQSTETAPPPEPVSPTKAAQQPGKPVTFELFLAEFPNRKARLPMRVNIFPHDNTDSIITTVKNFYGLYHHRGIILEDRDGNTLIARYENFAHGMVVYVRVSAGGLDSGEYSPAPHQSMSPHRPRIDDAFQMLPPTLHRPAATGDLHAAPRHSLSPHPGRGRRSASSKSRTRHAAQSRGTSSHGGFADANGDNYYSDSDGGNGSVTSSRRSKKEQVASADISVDNIVEGGRRFKRAKFDSSELPLFVPPQVPMTASLSSISPQRRINTQNCASPYNLANQQTFAYTHPLQSPQSHGQGETYYLQGLATPQTTSSGAQGYRSRTRGSAQYGPYRQGVPTPDPTLANASVISDEDVARQLMRLGDASNFSTHGRTSTSTLDDALSGKAEVASSGEDSEDSSVEEQEHLPLPPLPFATHGTNGEAIRAFDSGDTSGEDYDDNRDGSFKGESDGVAADKHQGHRLQSGGAKSRAPLSLAKADKPGKPRSLSKGAGKPVGLARQPISPTSMPPQSRKASNASLTFQHQLRADEEDLSSQPRCQRCRKSKKGCDRQRPCQRCKDAGIGIEGCLSEDEGNGRKGRYGRHMGVPVKKQQTESPASYAPGAPVDTMSHSLALSAAMEKSKKRKR